jgi:hypothetical protein
MTELAIAAALSVLSITLLGVLAGVWIREYREVRSPLVLGLVLFILVLLVENSVALYFYFATMETLYVDDPAVRTLVAIMRALQFIALVFLTYVSLR